jgi:hypothetical protein
MTGTVIYGVGENDDVVALDVGCLARVGAVGKAGWSGVLVLVIGRVFSGGSELMWRVAGPLGETVFYEYALSVVQGRSDE